MKLSDIKGERTLDVIADIIEFQSTLPVWGATSGHDSLLHD